MYGNYFPYGNFGINSGMIRGMMPGMSRMAGNSMLGNAARLAGGNTALKTPGILGNIFSGIKSLNWGGFLANTQKTLGIVNQAIPVYHQVKPLYNNARTALKVFRAVKDDNKTESNNKTSNIENNSTNINPSNNNISSSKGPNFFL